MSDELPVIDQPTAVSYAQAIVKYCLSEESTPDDAFSMLEDLRKYFEIRDTFCLFCGREGKPAPHEHESDDH